MKRPVLIVGSTPRITIPIARSLHRRGVRVEVASFSAIEAPPRSNAVFDFVRLPNPYGQTDSQSPAFVEFLARLISQRHYDMLIPANDPA
ncbi:MAG: hypothetical protein WCC85_22985, partial [Candidatus Sulfotelmatobacter sp.]